MRQQSSRQLITFLAYLAKTNANAVYDGPGSIQVNTPAGQLVVLKIDEATGAPLSVNYTDGGSKIVEHFSDWRQIGALKAPFKQETERDGKTYLVSAASDVKMNSNLTEEDLKKRQ